MKMTVELRNTKFIQVLIPAANRGVTPNHLFAELLEELIRKLEIGEYEKRWTANFGNFKIAPSKTDAFFTLLGRNLKFSVRMLSNCFLHRKVASSIPEIQLRRAHSSPFL